MIRTGLNFCAQEFFFKRHQNHAFYNLSYKESEKQGENNDEKEVKMNREFYKLNFKKSIQFAYCSNEFEASYPTIIVNRYALSEILRENPALPQKVSHDEDKIYVYFPAAVSSNSPEFESSIEMNPENLHREAMRKRMHAVRYNTHVDIVDFSYEDEKLHSILSSDPIIIYDSAIPMMRNEENFSLNASGLLPLQTFGSTYLFVRLVKNLSGPLNSLRSLAVRSFATIRKSRLVKNLSDSHGSFFAGSLLIAY